MSWADDLYSIFETDQGGIYDHEERRIFFIGIIDFLTQYGARKKLEHFLKSIKYDGDTISCVPS